MKRATFKQTSIVNRLMLLALAVLVAIVFATVGLTYADQEQSGAEEPLRAAHKVKVEDKEYCFFVRNNVVLSPSDMLDKETGEALDDKALTALIFERAGLFIKESNCTLASHTAINIDDWEKQGRRLLLSEGDMTSIRNAVPGEKSPVKLSMDICVSIEKEDEEPQLVSTFKLTSPEILFVAIATEEDAAQKEDICEPEKKEEEATNNAAETPAPKAKKVTAKTVPLPKEELPEFKTIKMVNREGEPLEDILKDGEPVTLTWKEKGKQADSTKESFFRRLDGKEWWIFIAAGILGIIIALAVVIHKARQRADYEE